MVNVRSFALGKKLRRVTGYYGSDLNKFIDEQCTREMTCNNIDCLLVKESKQEIKIIEYKKPTESVPWSQWNALRYIKSLINPNNGWKVGFYIVRGKYPFNKGADIIEVDPTNTKKILDNGHRGYVVLDKGFHLEQKQLKNWLEFKEYKLGHPSRVNLSEWM